MKLPNFIIAGCAKSGTTSLFQYMSLHPDIFLSTPKELRYFFHQEARPDFNGPLDEMRYNATAVYKWEDYCQMFDEADGYSVVGEASPVYMVSKEVPHAIAKKLGQIKIIVMLRNPVELAFSAYKHQVRNGGEDLPFEEALEQEGKRAHENWAWHWRYKGLGKVAAGVLAEYLSVFGKKNVKIIFYEDFCSDNEAVVRDVFEWLGLDASVPLSANRANDGVIYRRAKLKRFIQGVGLSKLALVLPSRMRKKLSAFIFKVERPQASEGIKEKLRCELKGEIAELSKITGRNLDHWILSKNR